MYVYILVCVCINIYILQIYIFINRRVLVSVQVTPPVQLHQRFSKYPYLLRSSGFLVCDSHLYWTGVPSNLPFISVLFLLSALHSIRYGCIFYYDRFRISSNTSKEPHLQLSESLFFYLCRQKSISLTCSITERAKILYKLACVSSLTLLLNVFASTPRTT